MRKTLMLSRPNAPRKLNFAKVGLAQQGRIAIDLRSPEFAKIFTRIHVWPLDIAICQKSMELDFASDLADELIAATSIVHRIPLVTRDKKIRKSKLVPFALHR